MKKSYIQIDKLVQQVKLRQKKGHKRAVGLRTGFSMRCSQSCTQAQNTENGYFFPPTRVNPSLIHHNTCSEVMQTATFTTITYLIFFKLNMLFTYFF